MAPTPTVLCTRCKTAVGLCTAAGSLYRHSLLYSTRDRLLLDEPLLPERVVYGTGDHLRSVTVCVDTICEEPRIRLVIIIASFEAAAVRLAEPRAQYISNRGRRSTKSTREKGRAGVSSCRRLTIVATRCFISRRRTRSDPMELSLARGGGTTSITRGPSGNCNSARASASRCVSKVTAFQQKRRSFVPATAAFPDHVRRQDAVSGIAGQECARAEHLA